MRNKALEIKDKDRIISFLNEMTFGFLSLNRTGEPPAIFPLNYVLLDENIYFHGSKNGERAALIELDGQVTFAIAREFSLIPSYFIDPKKACPATSYYKSIVLKGSINTVKALEEKARALEALMNKLQPEGGHVPIHTTEEIYSKILKNVIVWRLKIGELSAKFNFGQKKSEEVRIRIINQLESRNGPGDRESIQEIRKTFQK